MVTACLTDSQGNLYGSLLELGIAYADVVNTVSPEEVREVLERRESINPRVVEMLKQKGLEGILNGIDPSIINPESDHRIERYPTDNYKAIAKGKRENKLAFNREIENLSYQYTGGQIDPDKPLISMLCRLTEQKSIETVLGIAEKVNELGNIQLLLVGEAENKQIRDKAMDLANKYPRIFAHPYFANPDLQHRVLAASDAILQPSKWEPCGYTQLEGMVYGAIPIVTMVGGHKDTVVPYHDGKGYGITIASPTQEEIFEAIQKFKDLFQNKDAKRKAIMNAVQADFTWCGPKDSVGKYIALYEKAATMHAA
jgi:starch synthase